MSRYVKQENEKFHNKHNWKLYNSLYSHILYEILNRRIQCTGMFTIKLKYGTKVVIHYDDNIYTGIIYINKINTVHQI